MSVSIVSESKGEMSSRGKGFEIDTRKLLSLGKSVSCDNLRANSCIELADIRKLDSLLNQCESISCDNLLLFDDIYNYDLCRMNLRKYASTSAINKILPKNSIRRRAHKKVLGIRESDTKIIKFLDDVRNNRPETETDVENSEQNLPQQLTPSSNVDSVPHESGNDIMSPKSSHDQNHGTINCCDKNVQTSQIDLTAIATTTSALNVAASSTIITAAPSSTPVVKCSCGRDDKSFSVPKHVQDHHEKVSSSQSRKKERRKQCSCRDYKSVNTTNTICETSLSTVPSKSSRAPPKKILRDEKSTSIKYNRLMKQKNTIIDDYDEKGLDEDGCHENRVININKSVEIIPISLNSPYSSRPTTPHLGTSTNLHHGDGKSDKSETQSQKSKRSKFSPSFISRKLTSRLNSNELDDGAGGAKESLLGRGKSAEKKLPEPVETVCIALR